MVTQIRNAAEVAKLLSQLNSLETKTKHLMVSRLCNAAKVAKGATRVSGLGDKTKHLDEIHKLPEAAWQEAVEIMLLN